MSMAHGILRSVVIVLALSTPCLSQVRSTSIERLADAIQQIIQRQEPGWTFKRIEPIYENENVVIAQWSLGAESVRVSIVPHRSEQEASEILQKLVRDMKPQERQFNIGEDGYSWGYKGSETAFRKGKFIVYVSAMVSVENQADAIQLTDEERKERKSTEQRKLSLKFARLIAPALL